MKIILINNIYKPYSRGGAERIAELCVQGLTEQGNEVVVVAAAPEKKPVEDKIYWLDSFINRQFYNLNKLPIALRFFWHLSNLFNLDSYFKIGHILRTEKPDLVITHNLMGIGMLVPAAISKSRIKHLHVLHDIQLLHPGGLMNYGSENVTDNIFAKAYQAICRKLFSSVTKIVSPSNWLLNEHTKRNYFRNCQTQVLPNPVDKPESMAENVSLHINKNRFSFLCIGQIEEHKGVKFLINAFKKFNSGKAELLIVGDGSQYDSAKELAKDCYNIKLLGRKNHQEVFDLIRQADCLVLPSLCYENSPTVIYESLLSGLPVLASSLGGIPELLDNEEKLLFKPKEESELIAKMDWAMNNQEELKILSQSIAKKFDSYNLKNYIKSLLE